MKFRTINRSFWPRFTSVAAMLAALATKGASFAHAWETLTAQGARVAIARFTYRDI